MQKTYITYIVFSSSELENKTPELEINSRVQRKYKKVH